MGFNFQQGCDFLLTTTPRVVLGSSQLPIKQVLGVLSSRLNQPMFKTDHSNLSRAEITNA
jgi:hypothetical protein